MDTRGAGPAQEQARPVKDLRVLFIRIDQSSVFDEATWSQVFDNLSTLKDKQDQPVACCVLVHALDSFSRVRFNRCCEKFSVPPDMLYYLNDYIPQDGVQVLLEIIKKELVDYQKRKTQKHKQQPLLPELSTKIKESLGDFRRYYPELSDEALSLIAQKEAAACFVFKRAQAARYPDSGGVSLWPLDENQKWAFKSMPNVVITPFSPLMHYLVLKKQERLNELLQAELQQIQTRRSEALERGRLLGELCNRVVLNKCFEIFFEEQNRPGQIIEEPIKRFFMLSRFSYDKRVELRERFHVLRDLYASSAPAEKLNSIDFFQYSLGETKKECAQLRNQLDKTWRLQQIQQLARAVAQPGVLPEDQQARERLLDDRLLKEKERVRKSLVKEVHLLMGLKLCFQKFAWEEVQPPKHLCNIKLNEVERKEMLGQYVRLLLPEYKEGFERYIISSLPYNEFQLLSKSKKDTTQAFKDIEEQFNAFCATHADDALDEQMEQFSYHILRYHMQCDEMCDMIYDKWIKPSLQLEQSVARAPDAFFVVRPHPRRPSVSPLLNAVSASPAVGRGEATNAAAAAQATSAARSSGVSPLLLSSSAALGNSGPS